MIKMEIYVSYKNKEDLPEIEDLAFFMWANDISYSRAGDSTSFQNSSYLEIKWDKWVDDQRWAGKSTPYEYIDFEKNENKEDKYIKINISDEGLFVDKRAFNRAAVFIAEKANGKISIDKEHWVTASEFRDEYKYYIEIPFDKANEQSLNNK